MEKQKQIITDIQSLFASLIECVEVSEKISEDGETIRIASVGGVELPERAQERYFEVRGFVRSSFGELDSGFFESAASISKSARLVAGCIPSQNKALVFTQDSGRNHKHGKPVKICLALVKKEADFNSDNPIRASKTIDGVFIKENALASRRVERKIKQLQSIADQFNSGKLQSFAEAKMLVNKI